MENSRDYTDVEDRDDLKCDPYWCGHPSVEMIDGYIYYYTCEKSREKLRQLCDLNALKRDKGVLESPQTFDAASSDMTSVVRNTITVLLVSNVPYHVSPAELSEFLLQHDDQVDSETNRTAVDLIKVLRSPSTSSYFCLLFCYASKAFFLFNAVCHKPYNPLESQCCDAHLVKSVTVKFSSNKEYFTSSFSSSSSSLRLNVDSPSCVTHCHSSKDVFFNDCYAANGASPLPASPQGNFTTPCPQRASQREEFQSPKVATLRMCEKKYCHRGRSALTSLQDNKVQDEMLVNKLHTGMPQHFYNVNKKKEKHSKVVHHLKCQTTDLAEGFLNSRVQSGAFDRDESAQSSPTHICPRNGNTSQHDYFVHHPRTFLDDDDDLLGFSASSGPSRTVSLPNNLLRGQKDLSESSDVLTDASETLQKPFLNKNVDIDTIKDVIIRDSLLSGKRGFQESEHSGSLLDLHSSRDKTSPFTLMSRYESPAYCGVCLEKIFWSYPFQPLKDSTTLSASLDVLPYYDCVTEYSDGSKQKDISINVLCGHTFHAECLLKWYGARCPYCRYQQYPFKAPSCDICGKCENVKMCLVCGSLGCDDRDYVDLHSTQRINRFLEDHNGALFQQSNSCHAYQHFIDFQHVYAIEIESRRVWDFSQGLYVHRLLQTRTDRKLVEMLPLDTSLTTHKLDDSMTIEKASTGNLKKKHQDVLVDSISQTGSEEGTTQLSLTQFNYYSTHLFDEQQEFFLNKINHFYQQYEELNKDVASRYDNLQTELVQIEEAVERLKKETLEETRVHKTLSEKEGRLKEEYSSFIKLQRDLQKRVIQCNNTQHKAQSKAEEEIALGKKRIDELEQQITDLQFHVRTHQELVSSNAIQPGSFVVGYRNSSISLHQKRKPRRH